MASLQNERNIRAKIQEFERQINTDEISILTPRPRNTARPAVAPKTSMNQRASIRSTTKEETSTQTCPDNIYEEIISPNSSPAPPAPTLRPQIPKKPSLNSSDQFKPPPLIKPPPQLPSRPSLRRSTALSSQDEDMVFNTPRTAHNGQRNVNHHSSTKENVYMDDPVSKSYFHLHRKHTRQEEKKEWSIG